MTYRFFDDYSDGAHPAIAEAVLQASESGQEPGYGEDEFCRTAQQRIRRTFDTDGDVHFVTGATQANFIGLSAMLRPYEGVISPATGHIHVHEAGALEATGHKIITVDAVEGKLTPSSIDVALGTHEDEHTVVPKVAYLTQATETGDVYTRDEFYEVVGYAKSKGMYVFLDGARLAMALQSPRQPLAPMDIAAAGTDMFSIGGTKNGGMFGEAIVIANPELRKNFRYFLKRHGALMAKGRFLGAQFARFFDDDQLWSLLGQTAVATTLELSEGLRRLNVQLKGTPHANQVFAVLDKDVIAGLSQDYGFFVWAPVDEHRSVVRLVCSWATSNLMVHRFLDDLASLLDREPAPFQT